MEMVGDTVRDGLKKKILLEFVAVLSSYAIRCSDDLERLFHPPRLSSSKAGDSDNSLFDVIHP